MKMPQPHYNFYPPSGAVLDQNEPKAYWNGRAWMLNNRVYGVPSGHRLVGRADGPLDGWYYDWSKRAWMEPDRGGGGGGPIARRPQPQPIRQQPQQQTTPAAVPVKEKCMNAKDPNVLEYLMKHPIAPAAGAFLLLGSMLAEEPTPPQIPDDLPEPIQKQWTMLYNQNLQRFQRRMSIWENVGKVLMGYGETNAILAALPSVRKPA
jgi:hypothetical protein